ncbi:TIR domain-containing protein [Rhodoferax sp. OV413]|uniref:TIR domain-containing protein n=1 Tax=Rhodoferax sp. OV413 TaxID=1855285 RepID=UPI00088BF688|nr:TIR domain-containing protein [Rhodoferax sp. OV413]SDO96299.1 TIR domain-containing protein [Rhodoferax sp. OV413]
MQVFISWSGEHSKQVAAALRDWLPMVIQAIKPWFSTVDIEKGEAWLTSIQGSLSDSKGMGIFCLCPDNLAAPWLAFEAGALSAHDRGRVATFLHDVDASAIKAPLSLFQATKSADKEDVFNLLKTINARLEVPLEAGLLTRSFEANWQGLQHALNSILVQPGVAKRTAVDQNAMLKEILNTVRRLERDSEVRDVESDRILKRWSPTREYDSRDKSLQSLLKIAKARGADEEVIQALLRDHDRARLYVEKDIVGIQSPAEAFPFPVEESSARASRVRPTPP